MRKAIRISLFCALTFAAAGSHQLINATEPETIQQAIEQVKAIRDGRDRQENDRKRAEETLRIVRDRVLVLND